MVEAPGYVPNKNYNFSVAISVRSKNESVSHKAKCGKSNAKHGIDLSTVKFVEPSVNFY
jgi:hypothetical protein